MGRKAKLVMKRAFQQFSAFVLLNVLSACGGGSSSAPVNLAGNWQFTGQSTVFVDLNFVGTAALQQTGSSISGNLSLSGSPCATTAALSGSLSGTSVSFQIEEGNQANQFTGTVTPDGTSASGKYVAPNGGCLNGDAGTWSATKIASLSGVFAGSLHPNEVISVPSQATVNITQDDEGNLNGMAVLTNSSCFASLDLSGKVNGQSLTITASSLNMPEQSVRLDGKIDHAAKSITLTYTVIGGHCDGESGSGILARF